ncbi:MAG: histidinol-phosphate transaminase [Chloroflexi bacterium]|nr:histidinol-phosphate transaminase [Chloroflexota bacterium]
MQKITYAGGLSVEQVKDRVKADKIHKLSSNENPLGPSPKVVAALQAEAANLHVYPPRGNGRLCQALATYHQHGLTADHFFTAVSGVEILELIARAFVQPGDEVIVCPPTFGWYVKSAKVQSAEVVYVPLLDQTFSHDIDGILNAITPKTRLIYLCNPNNPTGAIITNAEMARLVQTVPDHVIIIADEVYQHFVTRDDYPHSIQYVLDEQNVIIIQSFSKAFALAGLRLGYAIAPPELSARVRGLKRPFHLSRLAIAAGIAALNDHAHLQSTVSMVQSGKDYLYKQLDALGVEYWKSETNFVLIRPSLDAQFVHDQLIERGIMVRPTKSNGLPGYLRVTIGLPEANQAFITALSEILQRKQQQI